MRLLDEARELSMYTAYNTNVDAITYLNGETVQRLIDEFGPMRSGEEWRSIQGR